MAKRRMAEVVTKRDGFGQILVESERAGDRSTDGGDFDRVSEACPQMVARPVQKDLRLIFEAAKRSRVNDSRPVALKFRSIGMTRFGILPPSRIARLLSKRQQDGTFGRLHLFPQSIPLT